MHWIENERRVLGEWVGERRDDQSALGPYGPEQGLHNRFRPGIHESDTPQGAVHHQQVSAAHANRNEIAHEVGTAQRRELRFGGSARCVVRRPWH